MLDGMPSQVNVCKIFDNVTTTKHCSIDLTLTRDLVNSSPLKQNTATRDLANSSQLKQNTAAKNKRKGLDFENLRLTPAVMFGHPDSMVFDFLESYEKVGVTNNL